MNAKPIWVIRFNPVTKEFLLVDMDCEIRMRSKHEYMRNRMSSFAFDQGAAEIIHDYDLVAIDGSGNGT